MIGIGVCKGLTQAPALKYLPVTLEIPAVPAADDEERRFLEACAQVKENLEGLYTRALERTGAGEAEVFQAHLMLLEDEDEVIGPILEKIRTEKKNAPQAVQEQFEVVYQVFDGLSLVEFPVPVLVALGVMTALGVEPLARSVAVMILAMPVASNGVLYCLEYGGSESRMTQMTLMSSAVSVVTIPLIASLLG